MQEETYTNVGSWAIGDLGLSLGAAHTPTFDRLMVAYRLAQQRLAEDEPRVRKLPRPWLGDALSRTLRHECDRARGRCVEYLLEHQELIIVGRRLG